MYFSFVIRILVILAQKQVNTRAFLELFDRRRVKRGVGKPFPYFEEDCSNPVAPTTTITIVARVRYLNAVGHDNLFLSCTVCGISSETVSKWDMVPGGGG